MTDWLSESTIDVGIDIGMRRIAYAWPSFGLVDSFDMGKKAGRRDYELRAMQEWLNTKVPEGVQLWVDQAFAGQGAVAMAQRLTETIAAVMTAQTWFLPPIVVHQATWKSQLIGNHMADKAEINAWLAEHRPDLHRLCETEDEYDATAIALYGKERSEGRILAPVPKKKPRRKAKKA